MNEPNSYFALGITQNPTFPIDDIETRFSSKIFPGRQFTIREFVRENFQTSFSGGLARNPNYKLRTTAEIELCRNNIDAAAAYYITQRPEYPIGAKERQIVRTNPKSMFVRGAVRNKNRWTEPGSKMAGCASSVRLHKTRSTESPRSYGGRNHCAVDDFFRLGQKYLSALCRILRSVSKMLRRCRLFFVGDVAAKKVTAASL